MLVFTCSCATSQYRVSEKLQGGASNLSTDIHQKISLLQYDLEALSNDIDSNEARELAETGIRYSLILRDEYKLVRPPYLHNILVQCKN